MKGAVIIILQCTHFHEEKQYENKSTATKYNTSIIEAAKEAFLYRCFAP